MLNKVQLIGNLGRDPEIRTTQDGKEVATLSLGVSERWQDKQSGERRESTEWVRVVIFNERLVTLVKNYTSKGSKIYVEGKFKTREWTDNQQVKRYTTEVVLGGFGGAIELLSPRKEGGGGDNAQDYAAATGAEMPADLDDEIPF